MLTVWLWRISEAAAQQWEGDQIISGWDALLEQLPFFLIVIFLVLVAWSVVLLVLWTVLPFAVLGMSTKLDRINRSLQALSHDIMGITREEHQAHQGAGELSRGEGQGAAG